MRDAKLDRFRHVAFWEGVSYVALLGIAMPIKYLGGVPEPVKYVGWAHGILFILYVALLADAARRFRWSARRVGLYFLASLLPVAPFFVERALRREQAAAG